MEVDAHGKHGQDDHEQEPALAPVRLEKGHGQEPGADDAREDRRVSKTPAHGGRLRLSRRNGTLEKSAARDIMRQVPRGTIRESNR